MNPAKIVECVVNISEGRDKAVINQIVDVLEAEGISVLHVDSGASAHRSVITFAGELQSVEKAVKALYRKSLELIDMRLHKGVHPRLGAVDVCPFIPLTNCSMEDCVTLSERVGQYVASTLNLPVYLYCRAARTEAKRSLSAIRSGELEGLAEKMQKKEWAPDYGPMTPHPTAGATVVGARPFLLAYNVTLATEDVKVARYIAKHIRETSNSETGLKSVKALGWVIPEYGAAQVSCNVLDYKNNGLLEVFDSIKEAAQSSGVHVTGSEIIGMTPHDALLDAGRKILARTESNEIDKMETLEDAAIQYLGLSIHAPFEKDKKIIEMKLKSYSMT